MTDCNELLGAALISHAGAEQAIAADSPVSGLYR